MYGYQLNLLNGLYARISSAFDARMQFPVGEIKAELSNFFYLN